MRGDIIVVLISTSLMINDVEHFFMCIQVIYPFSNQIIIILCVCVHAFVLYELYSLDTNHLSDIWFANIFSHSVGCLFILLIFFFCCSEAF